MTDTLLAYLQAEDERRVSADWQSRAMVAEARLARIVQLCEQWSHTGLFPRNVVPRSEVLDLALGLPHPLDGSDGLAALQKLKAAGLA